MEVEVMKNTEFERLYRLRKKSGKSQEEIADQLGISRQALSKWENGESFPTTENLIALAKIYNVSVDELVGNTVDKIVPDVPQEVKKKKITSLVYMIAGPFATIFFFLTLALFPKFSMPWIWFLFVPIAGGIARFYDKKNKL